MLTETQLNDRLEHWAREYGWGGMPRESGSNILQRIMDGVGARGRDVVLNTLGDQVEHAVKLMACTPAPRGCTNTLFRAATVLRVKHLTPHYWPESERLRRLKMIGLPMSRDAYYRADLMGRSYLLGYLSSGRTDLAA